METDWAKQVMTFKTILVPVNGDAEDGTALGTALSIGKRFGARVEAIHAAEVPQPLDPDWENMKKTGMGYLMLMHMREADQHKSAARQALEDACKRHAVPIREAGWSGSGCHAEFRVVSGVAAVVIPRRARIADLIVTAQPDVSGGATSSETLEAVLMDSGRPVLVVPPEGKVEFEGIVGLGWNGRPEASRALLFALPLLAIAREVVVIEVDEAGQRRGLGGESVVEYLASHGVTARSIGVGRSGETVGECLLTAARSAGVDQLVMGGNAKSRLRQLIFGGVTGDVIAGAKIPVLIAH